VNAVLFCVHAMSRLPPRNKVHVELEKLRCKNREENAKIRADARFAYEQRIHDVANDSLADSSSLASFIESSVAGMALKQYVTFSLTIVMRRSTFVGAVDSSLAVANELQMTARCILHSSRLVSFNATTNTYHSHM
jgi:hypothetical protein